MASKFMNTTHKVTIDNLVDGYKDKIKNPYYIHSDSKPSIVTYFTQNKRLSTLDEGAKIEYSGLGKDSPLKYNKINGFYLYGLEKITTELEYGEWGLESTGIEGEATLLPNTIIPIPNDFFIINHGDKKLLFKVINVTMNTIENGSNLYKISYKLDQTDSSKINSQVVEEYEMIATNSGTQFKTIIKKEDYHQVEHVECILDMLKKYYCELFYSSRVQTFIFKIKDKNFYDPYMIEFIKKHNLFKNMDEYLYITQQVVIPSTFSLDYDKTMFRYVEHHHNKKNKRPYIYSQATYIDEYLSILSMRAEDYYKIHYINSNDANPNMHVIQNYNQEFIDRIFENNKYKDNNYLNIIIKYFNKEKITIEDIYTIEDIEYEPDMTLFYNIPILIFILEENIKNILVNK